MQFVGRAGLEFGEEMKVRVPGFLGLGMHHKTPAADALRELEQAAQHVLQHGGTQSLAFVAEVYPQAGEQRDGLWVASSSFEYAIGRGSGRNLGHAPRVVGDDDWACRLGDDEHLRRASCARLPGESLEPLGLFDGATGEPGNVVSVSEQLGRTVPADHSLNGVGRSIRC